jgi:heterodisulfide reductase subunit C
MGRAKCGLSVSVCEVLLKSHVSSIDSGLHLSDDMEVVVASVVGFLGAAGNHTVRLNATVVAAAAKTVLGVNDVVAKKFGDAMAHAFSFCVAKGCKAVSGKKLSCVSFQTMAIAVAMASASEKKVSQRQ